MKSSPAYRDYVMNFLSPHGPITARAMFGGYGIYYDRVIFASIVEDRLFFRVDEINRADFEAFDAEPFVYEGSGKQVTMPYLTLPEAILHDPTQLKRWIEKARQASLNHKLKKKK